MTGASVEMSSRKGTASSRQLLARLAAVYRLLDQRRGTAEHLHRLIDQLDQAKLLPVVGARRLVERLDGRLGEAAAALDELATDATAAASACVGRLEELLNRVEWSVAADTVARLETQRAEQDAAIRALTEDLGTYRLWFDRYRRELKSAMDAGAPLSADDTQLLADIDGMARQADQGAAQGRFDTVAVALLRARKTLEEHGLWEAAAFEDRLTKIASDRTAVERREALMTRRAELFLIAAPRTGSDGQQDAGIGGAREYRVLLRRPSFETAQESNLHEQMKINDEDWRLFRATIDEIADAATKGVRSVADKAAAPTTGLAAGPASEPIRGIVMPAQRALDEHPAARLERVGRLMYSLLIPDAMQRLIDETSCPLTITANDLVLPWELMHDGEEFLCLKRPFARMPVGQTFPRRSRRTVRAPRATWNVLLIHSDPDGDLGDSGVEIDEIQKTLQALPVRVRPEVLSGDRANQDLVTQHLASGQFDLIHYAGHAGFDVKDPTRSFLLLHGKKRFFADRIQRILEGQPIVFLNACDTSQTQNENETASTSGIVARAQGLASAFVYGGAQACIGTMWPVFDDTARNLAASFYTKLLTRQRVGEALCEARATSRKLHTDQLTWAAYALYGDPLYRLREGAPASQVPATLGNT